MSATAHVEDKNAARLPLALRVTNVRQVAERVNEITFAAADGGSLPPWEPGAHVSFRLSDDVERQYSLCGPLRRNDEWRVAVLNAPQGRGGSAAIHSDWKVGHLVEASAPRNHFPLDHADSYLFIAGGIGITPILPMIEKVRGTGRPWRLVYGGRNRASMAYLDRLAGLNGDVRILPEDEMGRPDLASLTADLPPNSLVYTCGPEGLLNALVHLSSGWTKNQLRLERFSPVTITDSEDDRPFVAHLRASGVSIEVGANESLLGAMARAGVAPPSACREGTCGTCETRVLSGAILHRDSVLSEDERAAGEWMMACVSRAEGPDIEIDA